MVQEQLATFSGSPGKQADTSLCSYHQTIFIRYNIAYNIRWNGFLISFSLSIHCKSSGLYIQFIDTSQVQSQPYTVFRLIIPDGFHIIMRNAIGSRAMNKPLESTFFRIKPIQSSSLRTNPNMPSLVFKHISYNRTAQSFRRIVFFLEETIYGIFRIKIVHPTKISSSPNCPLTILLETPYRRMGQSIRINPFAVVFHTACTGIQAIQSGFSPYPKTTLVIFFETAYKIRRKGRFT